MPLNLKIPVRIVPVKFRKLVIMKDLGKQILTKKGVVANIAGQCIFEPETK